MSVPARTSRSADGRSGRRGLGYWVKVAFGLAVVVAASWYIARSWAEVAKALGSMSLLAVIFAVPAAVGGVVAAMLAWRTLLADLGSRLEVRDAGRVFFLSQLGKYLPGSVWPFLAQIELGHELKVPRAVSLAASVLAILLSLVVGIAVAATTVLVGSPTALRTFWWVLLVVPFLIAALHPRVAVGGVNLALKVTRRPPLAVRPTWRGTARAALWQAMSWLLLGLHCAFLVTAAGAAGLSVVPLAIGAFALAYCAGVLFLPSPAGAGIREVALAAGLAGVLAQPQAIAVVLVSRFMLVVVDAAVAGAWWRVGKPMNGRLGWLRQLHRAASVWLWPSGS